MPWSVAKTSAGMQECNDRQNTQIHRRSSQVNTRTSESLSPLSAKSSIPKCSPFNDNSFQLNGRNHPNFDCSSHRLQLCLRSRTAKRLIFIFAASSEESCTICRMPSSFFSTSFQNSVHIFWISMPLHAAIQCLQCVEFAKQNVQASWQDVDPVPVCGTYPSR